MFDTVMSAAALFDVSTLAVVVAGVLLGYVVGVVPGLSRPTALAVALPFTYTLSPIAAISLLIGVAKGSAAGGAITAILLNIPGEPSSAATTFDGYPMTTQGRGGKALKVALYSSVVGDIIATLLLIIVAQPMAALALTLGPVELWSIIVFSTSFIIALSGDSLLKGVLSALIGMFVATIGLDAGTGSQRMTFGLLDLRDGVSIIAMSIGLMALSEMMIQIDQIMSRKSVRTPDAVADVSDMSVPSSEWVQLAPTMFRSSLLGVIVGIIPGLGATVASFMSYTVARQRSKNPERFGSGAAEGVAASETADNAANVGAFIPLFALGIPGSLTAALLMGAFIIHGLPVGPMMFRQELSMVYAVYISLILSSVALLAVGLAGMRAFAYMTKVSVAIICPVVIVTAIVGAYVEGYSLAAIATVLVFGCVGFLIHKAGMSYIPMLIGFILGPMLEGYTRQAIILMDGDVKRLVEHPIAVAVLVSTIVALWQFRKIRSASQSGLESSQYRSQES